MFLAILVGALQQIGPEPIPSEAVQLQSGTVKAVVEQIAQRPASFAMNGRENRPVAVVANGLPADQILQHIAQATRTTLTNTEQSLSLRHTAEDSKAIQEDWHQHAIKSLNAYIESRPADGEFMGQVDRVKHLLDRYIRAPNMRERFELTPEIRNHSLEDLLMLKILKDRLPEIRRELQSLDLRQQRRPSYAIRIQYDPPNNSQWESDLISQYNASRLALRSVSNTFIASYGESEFMDVGLPTTSEPARDIWVIWKPGNSFITINLYVFGERGEAMAFGNARVAFHPHPYATPEWLEKLQPVDAPLAAQLALADPFILDPDATRLSYVEPAPNREWLTGFLASGGNFASALDPIATEIARVTGKTVIAAWPDFAYTPAMRHFEDGQIDPQPAILQMLFSGAIAIQESDEAIVITSEHPMFNLLYDVPHNVKSAIYRGSRQSMRIHILQLARAIALENTADYYTAPHFLHYLRLLNAIGIPGPDQNILNVEALMLLGHLQIPANWMETMPLQWNSTQWSASVSRYALNWLNTSMFIHPVEPSPDEGLLRERFTPYLLHGGIPANLSLSLDLDVITYWNLEGATPNFAGLPLDTLARMIGNSLDQNPSMSIQEAVEVHGPVTFNDFQTLELRLSFPDGNGVRRTATLIEGAPKSPYLDYADWSPEIKQYLSKRIEEIRRTMQIDPSG